MYVAIISVSNSAKDQYIQQLVCGQTINSQVAVDLFAVRLRLNHLASYGRRRRSCAVKVKSLAASLDCTSGRRTIQRLLAFTADVTLLQTVTGQIVDCLSLQGLRGV